MLSLLNFETQINAVILQRGRLYFQNGNVENIEEAEDKTWRAEVTGSDLYSVEVILKGNKEITGYSCDCPYDEGICKHTVAVLFALVEILKKQKNKPKGASKKDVFENLLQTISLKEYQDFISQYAAKNKNFKTEFELFFADKDSRIDVEKKYSDLIERMIKKYSRGGYIDYRSSFGLSKEVDALLKTGDACIAKNNFRDAFALARAVLKPMMLAIMDSDDSNGNIGSSIEGALGILENIAAANAAAITIKEQLFGFVTSELGNKMYFDYGDFGYQLFSIFQILAVQLNAGDIFLGFIDAQSAKLSGEYEGYRKEFFQKRKIEFLQLTGKVDEAGNLIQQHIDIVEVRQNEVNKAIDTNDFNKAKKLITAGIKVAEAKSHPGTVTQWQNELLRIAVLEKDIGTIRHYSKYFAFDHGFSPDYYNQFKKTYPAAEWKIIIENYIAETIQKITYSWSNNKHTIWHHPAYPPLLQSLAPIYIQEKYWDRLLALVQQNNNLNTTLAYHNHLVKIYPGELLKIYLPSLEKYGVESTGRSTYADMVSKMKMVMKDIPDSKEKIIALAQKLRLQFSVKPRRPDMMEELDKILK